MNGKRYIQHASKAVEDDRFSHMMALTLDPSSNYKRGVIRCITSREGNVEVEGYVDRSELYTVSGDSLEHFIVGERLRLESEQEILAQLAGDDWDCLGLEDPDIFFDDLTSLIHLYFTIPFKHRSEKKMQIHLGHAMGNSLDSLKMTMPVLQSGKDGKESAKEVSIAPTNRKGVRLNLFEGSVVEQGIWYSIVRIAIAKDMSKPWEYGPTVFHPKEHNIPWIGGHASPGPLFPRNFIDVGEGKLAGIINGREANQQVGDKIKYGIFSVGLFIYDYENGLIDWISPEPFIRDTEGETITFASQFIETGNGKGLLYAHVDDSFVRAYTLNAEVIRSLLP